MLLMVKASNRKTNLTISISSGSGDADLYVKTGQPPTQSLYDCRPYQSTNNETCVAPLVNEDLYIMLRAYRSFAGVSLTATENNNDSSHPRRRENLMNKLFVMALMSAALSANAEDKVWISMGADAVGSLNPALSESLLPHSFASGSQVWIAKSLSTSLPSFHIRCMSNIIAAVATWYTPQHKVRWLR